MSRETAGRNIPLVSADWRFLPGIPAGGRVLLCGSGFEVMTNDLAAIYDEVVVMPEVPQEKALSELRFDMVALPDGLPTDEKGQNSLREVYSWMRPGGVLYIGTRGWPMLTRLWHGQQTAGGWTRVAQLRRWLVQSGYMDVMIYGAVPDHLAPAFLMPLKRECVAYVFGRFLARVKFAPLRRLAADVHVGGRLGRFLPGYALVARRVNE